MEGERGLDEGSTGSELAEEVGGGIAGVGDNCCLGAFLVVVVLGQGLISVGRIQVRSGGGRRVG